MVIVPKKIPRRNRRKSRERDRELLRQRRRKILNRIKNQPAPERDVPMITAANIHYELGQLHPRPLRRAASAPCCCWRNTGLISAIDSDLHLLKRHLPYHESDHVLNIALNIIAGGRRLEHIELRGATTPSSSMPSMPGAIPDPDHRRRFLPSLPPIRCPRSDGGHP